MDEPTIACPLGAEDYRKRLCSFGTGRRGATDHYDPHPDQDDDASADYS
jgi:hypothetical protein